MNESMPRLIRRRALVAPFQVSLAVSAGNARDTARLFREVLNKASDSPRTATPLPQIKSCPNISSQLPESAPEIALPNSRKWIKTSPELLKICQDALGGYKFRNPSFCFEALSSPSVRKLPRSLALIGDAQLRLKCALLSYEWYHRHGVSDLEKLKALATYFNSELQSNSRLRQVWDHHFQSITLLDYPGGKDTATVLEALIGAVYCDTGDKAVDPVLRHLGLLPDLSDSVQTDAIVLKRKSTRVYDTLSASGTQRSVLQTDHDDHSSEIESYDPEENLDDLIDVEDGKGEPVPGDNSAGLHVSTGTEAEAEQNVVTTGTISEHYVLTKDTAPRYICLRDPQWESRPKELLSIFGHLPGLLAVARIPQSNRRNPWWLQRGKAILVFESSHAAFSAVSEVIQRIPGGAWLEYMGDPKVRLRLNLPDGTEATEDVLKRRPDLPGLRQTKWQRVGRSFDFYFYLFTEEQAVAAMEILKDSDSEYNPIVKNLTHPLANEPGLCDLFPLSTGGSGKESRVDSGSAAPSKPTDVEDDNSNDALVQGVINEHDGDELDESNGAVVDDRNLASSDQQPGGKLVLLPSLTQTQSPLADKPENITRDGNVSYDPILPVNKISDSGDGNAVKGDEAIKIPRISYSAKQSSRSSDGPWRDARKVLEDTASLPGRRRDAGEAGIPQNNVADAATNRTESRQTNSANTESFSNNQQEAKKLDVVQDGGQIDVKFNNELDFLISDALQKHYQKKVASRRNR